MSFFLAATWESSTHALVLNSFLLVEFSPFAQGSRRQPTRHVTLVWHYPPSRPGEQSAALSCRYVAQLRSMLLLYMIRENITRRRLTQTRHMTGRVIQALSRTGSLIGLAHTWTPQGVFTSSHSRRTALLFDNDFLCNGNLYEV